MAFDDTRVPRLGEAGDDRIEVAFEVLGEPAEAEQVGGGSGRFDPLRQPLAVQLGDHAGEGAHVPGERSQVGQLAKTTLS
ncbi:hypothetical protein CP982_40300 [Streptomyces spectabilis]|uniref:Uncharacterized protein n=1 Tax=Streptomyces spectabilis TaxID=68270 RepID=A0A5P2XNS7_STRST|nr:hypothetical protein CP982_40300 [Streptomyces spectabilis]